MGVIRKFPSIEYSCIVEEYAPCSMTLEAIIEIMQCCKKINKLQIFNGNMTIDLDAYKSIVASATGQVEVKISCKNCSNNVQKDIKNESNKWVQFEERRWRPISMSLFHKPKLL